jgi:formate dehydrogenase subunit delta
MDIERLTYMANQIARNLEARGHDAAVAETATHIIKFWDPRMKANMLGGDRSGLTPLAAEAMLKVEADVAAKAQAA